jgi:hypothetical protein
LGAGKSHRKRAIGDKKTISLLSVIGLVMCINGLKLVNQFEGSAFSRHGVDVRSFDFGAME